MPIVYTCGVWENLHRAHRNLLCYARRLAGPDGKVVVGVNTDFWVEFNKGRRTKEDLLTRVKNISKLRLPSTTEIDPLLERWTGKRGIRLNEDIVDAIWPINEEDDILDHLYMLDYIGNGLVYLIKGDEYKPQDITGAGLSFVKLVLVPVGRDEDNEQISSTRMAKGEGKESWK